jgi:2-polyprenyl-3-methyl-5-hydroxy-6-metoxy-1,4-benzoquinol methylase
MKHTIRDESSRGKHRKRGPQYPDERMKCILAEILSADHVLDIGVANHDSLDAMERGVWLHGLLKDKAAAIVGVDILPDEVCRLRKMGYSIVLADVETMQLGQKFDVIVAGEIIEHLSNPGAFLDRAYEHLTTDGRLIVTTPYPWSFVCFAGTLFNKLSINEEHACWFDPVTLTQLLNRHRFAVVKLKLVRLPVGARGWRVSHLLCDVGLERIGACGQLVVCRPQRMDLPGVIV